MENGQPSPPIPQFTSPPPSSSTSVLVLALSILGILTISLLLFIYYLFITKCFHISWRLSGTSTISRRHQRHNRNDFPVLYSTTVAGRGLSDSMIQSIPTICYGKGIHNKKLSFHECAVCINEFQEGERIRLLPNCFHVFHLDCIDVWLQSNANCPLCRSSITACPMALFDLVGSTSQEDGNENNNDIVMEIRDDDLHLSSFAERGSMGDECIDITTKDDLGMVPMRRSFSMDSSNDRQLYLALQKRVRESALACRNEDPIEGSSSNSSNGVTGKLRRGFFSFNLNRSSRSAVLPI